MGIDAHRVIAADPAGDEPIQRALDALNGSGVVYLPPGTYGLTRTIALPSNVSIVGAGAQLTTIVLAPDSSCHVFTNDDHAKGNEHIELRGFRLEGNMRDQPKPPDLKGITFACGGYFKRVRHLAIDDIVAVGIRQTAFHFNHCDGVDIHRLEADQLGWSGVSTSGTDDIVLRRVVVTNSGLDVRHSGIHLDGGTGAYVDALVDVCTGNGIMLDSKFSPLSDVVVKGVARGCMRGLSLSGDHDHPLTNVSVSGEYCDNREVGILVSNASNVLIVDATIASNGTAGLVLQGKAGSPHCVVAASRITGSPDLILERDGNQVAYVTTSALVDAPTGVQPLATDGSSQKPAPPKAAAPASRTPPPITRRVRNRLARARREMTRPAPAAAPAAAGTAAQATPPPTVDDNDSYRGACNVCGEQQEFVRNNASLREGYRCTRCKASLRYRGQADAILRRYARHGATTIAALVEEPEFAALSFWEPGVLGCFREHFTKMPGYVMSDYWPDVKPGDERDGVRCEDLMALTFADQSFDLVLTSDIFEHVRKPFVGFAEVHRVLRPGGRHIFSIPIQDPWRKLTVERVDVSGDDDVHTLEPRYHLGPGNSKHIVYNDFGQDLVENLDKVGFDTDVIRFEAPNPEAARLLTLCSTRR